MPTIETDTRTQNTLPDIFRTISGINLDIGLLDRLRESDTPDDTAPWGRGDKGAKGRSNFPRIILRDALGRELDTFTTLQEAIYRAKWNVKQSGQAKVPLEWRLPKAPPPARPDLTRTFPPLKHPPAHPPDDKLKAKFDSSRVLEFDVEDVGFVRESLQYLPYAPSLSFLKQEILVGPKTYFQIVGTMLLHKKFLSQTEKRHAIYNFPGFCSGCMRMGLCYGCERSTEIHFHEDKPVKTGGGFTYFKKDRPEKEIKSRNPINWKIQHPDKALKKLMEEYAGVELEGAIPDEIKQHLDKHGGHRERIVSNIPDFAREMKEFDDKEKLNRGDGFLPDIHVRYDHQDGSDGDLESLGDGHSSRRGHDLEGHSGREGDLDSQYEGHSGRRHYDLDPNDVRVHIQGQDDTDEEDDYNGNQRRQKFSGGRGKGHPDGVDVPKSGATSWSKTQSGMLDGTLKSGHNASDDEGRRAASYDRYDRHGHRLPKYRRVESGSDEENDEREKSDTEDYSSRRSRRKEKLYKAPPAFKLKKSPKRSIVSKSPFSTDREYDLPKGKGLDIKKSDKPPTQFKEFRNVDASWKEPKKFELKKNENKTTKFWSGPPPKKKENFKKKGDRSHGLRRVPSPRSVSPDSGLESELLTEISKENTNVNVHDVEDFTQLENFLTRVFDFDEEIEFDVEDVGFVRESLQYLPYAPSLSFLKQEILVGPKTYFQIVGTMLLHKKFLSQTEKRHAIYNFPGFCSGCMRMGLCYGCERSTEIHFHEDKPVKTGGGFTYFKKDRPEKEIKSRNPINWKIQHPDKALKKLMEEYAGVELEGAIPDEIKQHLDKHGGHRERIVSNIPDFAREMKEFNDKEKLNRGDGFLPDIHVRYDHKDGSDGDLESLGEGHSSRRGHDLEGHSCREGHDHDSQDEGQSGRKHYDLDPNDVRVHIQGQDDTDEEDDYNGNQRRQKFSGGRGKGHPSGVDVPKSGATSWSKTQSGMRDGTLKSGHSTSDDEGHRAASYDRYDRHGHRLPKYRRVESGSDEENDECEKSDTEDYSSRRSRRKEKLYKDTDGLRTAPPAFKLKKSPKRSIVSKSPFSTDREYDLPKGKGLDIKKSDKPPTQFKEFRNVDASWKEPKKFELKKNENKTTKFWSGPPPKKKENFKKKGDRSHGLRRVPSPRSVSPDSGLESELLTGQSHDGEVYGVIETERGRKNGKKSTGDRKKRSKERSQRKAKIKDSSRERGKIKGKNGRRDSLSDEEVDLNQLPSIKSQLAKIFESQNNKSEVNNADEDTSEDENIDDATDLEENSDNEKEIGNNRWERKRPTSAERADFLRVPGIKLKKYRSMSMPLLGDIEELQQRFGKLSLEQLKAPIKVPIYLPVFKRGSVILKKQFKSNPKRVKGRERSMSVSVVTFPPQLVDFEDTTNKSEPLEPVREETLTITPDMGLSERTGTPLQLRVQSPVPDKPPRSVSPPKKREIVKKVKKPPPVSPAPVPVEPKPPTPVKEKTPSPVPVEEERPVSREISFDFVKEKSVPELPPIEIPELPEIQERQSEYKGVKKERKLIEVTPEIPEPKKKLPPPPKVAPRIKTRTSRKSKVAEAPVTTQELQQLSDPLDFLAKYCIINPDRLPYYERVFNSAVNVQTPRYTRDHMAARGGIVHLPPAQLSDHELNMLKDLTVITHAQTPRRDGVSVPEQYLEKLNYSIEFIKTKQDALQDHMHELQVEKIHLMAQLAKQLDRDIVRVDYKSKGKKKKKGDDDENSPKKKKKKKSEEPDYDTMGAMSVPKNFIPQRASDITDEVIVSRMDDKMMKKVKKDPTVKKLQMQISRDLEKLKHFDQRVAQIEDEKDLVGLYCMDYYFSEQDESMPPYEFRRQQSRLYQKLHPDPDIEMNTEEVETALQQINNKLLSEKEFQYIYFILDLPKREKINFRLFSIIAALSEKVTQMDPVIRKLMNKVDYNALDIKMEKSKELFELLQDESQLPVGNAPAETLAVELTAGGLTPEHTNYVLSKFNREGRGFVDFLDFVTYVPLFIEIHKRIIEDPFNDTLNV
ncbi:uncharacterized protein LOC123540018 [Mercenaria mercenaria]|uniref:uncharacterized protein LOC123540018 n=1 Tax=Mercenaria mercenaria TaxID=6596 RepID=UPI00234EC41D|nr:uncharacterized protein LOC123540018 [Mercenaria mercenaria]